MLYYLDTNICVPFLRRRKPVEIIGRKMLLQPRSSVKIPAIVAGELMYGAYKSERWEKNVQETKDFLADFEIVPLDYQAAIAYGQIRASLERNGQVISFNDMFIAATALSRNGVLVTNNTREFSRIDGLQLEDWTQ